MDIEKTFFNKIFENLFSDTVTVRYYDKEEVTYGDKEAKFKIIFNKPLKKSDILKNPTTAFAEAYTEGAIEIQGDLQKLVESMYTNKNSFLHKEYKALKLLTKTNNLKRSKDNVEHHYDIGNDFYKLWLDDTMMYSCAYFKEEENTLFKAQKDKVAHILKKLTLNKGDKLLDIGCGWGELIISAAKEYGVKATGITLSQEQHKKVKERIKKENLEDLVDVKILDYRNINDEKFNRIVSVGMLEHVGKDHIREYFKKVEDLLLDGGLSMVHSITAPKEGCTNDWMNKYIFPGGYVPGISEIIENITSHCFYLLDVESLRRHYGKTLHHWAKNFEGNLPKIKIDKDEKFIRMWRLYLNSCAASFNTGNIDLHQVVFTKGINNELPWTREHIYK